jgi:hypothetical protein
MNARSAEEAPPRYGVDETVPHAFHECRGADEFRERFEAATGAAVRDIADGVIAPAAPKAIFLVGSLPLGMATSSSDIDFVVLIDSRAALLNENSALANTDQQLQFSNDTDALLAGMYLTQRAGIYVDLQVAITPEIRRVQSRLRRRGPELTENEIRILGRLSTGWLLWQSDDYLKSTAVVLNDPALNIYVCTKSFVSALIHCRKGLKALDVDDLVLALQLGRSSVELAYLAYFASEGIPYLGAKWPAQIGGARAAPERLQRHPLLRESIPLLFPTYNPTTKDSAVQNLLAAASAAQYLRDVGDFLASMQALIEQKTLYRIAFKACPQIGTA